MQQNFCSANHPCPVHSCARTMTMAGPSLELVVARFREDLSWLRRVPGEFRITVYEKGDGPCSGERLPNAGREAHTYLHHLAERRDTLAALTVFVQGRPFDHAPDLHTRLREFAASARTVDGFWWLGFLADTDDMRGRRLFVPWSKNPERRELNLGDFHPRVFGEPSPPLYRFFAGAQFAVSREAAWRRDAAFYSRAREVSLSFPDAAHCFERCWDRVFGVDGTAARLPEGQLTAYFKPVRRLGAVKDPLVPRQPGR